MPGVARHHCNRTDDDGRPLKPLTATCGSCGRSWCERCDPTPSPLCHYCNGMGYSNAPVPPRQAREAHRSEA